MKTTLIDHPRLQVDLVTGSEGPKHDPYAYREFHVTVPDGDVVLHEGLGTWLKFNTTLIQAPADLSWDQKETWLRKEAFRNLVGRSVEQIERIAHRLNSRCKKCGGRSFHSESGYPGEYFNVCDNCNNIVSTEFYESEII